MCVSFSVLQNSTLHVTCSFGLEVLEYSIKVGLFE